MNEYNIGKRSGIYTKETVLYIALGWICAFLSLLILPYVFGVIGVIMGILAAKNGSRLGLPIIMASIVLMGIGLMFNNVILDYTIRKFNLAIFKLA